MSLLLASLIQNSKKTASIRDEGDASAHQDNQLQIIKKQRTWLLTYIALFTSLLAFFILIISLVELEGSTPKRNYQKLVADLHQRVEEQKQELGIPWLQVENTLTKGVRLSLPVNLVEGQSLFKSASAQLNPRYLPYLRSVLQLLEGLELTQFRQRYAKWIPGIELEGYELQLLVRVEGHTDSIPLSNGARFADNVELSTFRAYAMMEWLRIHSGLPRKQFVIAGYGSFHPLMPDATHPANRRIEIYLLPQLRAMPDNLSTLEEEAL